MHEAILAYQQLVYTVSTYIARQLKPYCIKMLKTYYICPTEFSSVLLFLKIDLFNVTATYH